MFIHPVFTLKYEKSAAIADGALCHDIDLAII